MEFDNHAILSSILKRKVPDMTVIVGDKSFECHEEILMGTSEYFRAALSVDMMEGQTRRISMSENKELGITSENFTIIIKDILYEGKSKIIIEKQEMNRKLPGLILLANYLQMPIILKWLHNFLFCVQQKLSQKCICQLAALPVNGFMDFKETSVKLIIAHFHDFFNALDSIGYQLDFETFCMILDNEEFSLQEAVLLKVATNWVRKNDGWSHYEEILSRIRMGCISPADLETLLPPERLEHISEDLRSYIIKLKHGRGTAHNVFSLMNKRRLGQVVLDGNLDSKIVVGFSKNGSTVQGHMWDEQNQRWIENGFKIKNCRSNIAVRKNPKTYEESLIFMTMHFTLYELKSGNSNPLRLGKLPEFLTTSQGGCSGKIHLHYYGVTWEECDGHVVEQLYVMWGPCAIKFHFEREDFEIFSDLPGHGRYMLSVEKSVNIENIGDFFLCFGNNYKTFVMTYVEHLEQSIAASGEGPLLSGKVWTPFVAIPDHRHDLQSVYILNFTDLTVKHVYIEGNADEEYATLMLKNPEGIAGNPATVGAPPTLHRKHGLTLCVGNGKLYTVYHDCVLDTGIACDGTTIPEIPEAQLRKNPAYAERYRGILPPADIKTVMVLPLGLCRNTGINTSE